MICVQYDDIILGNFSIFGDEEKKVKLGDSLLLDASNLIGRINVGLHDRKKDLPAPKESPSGLPRAIQNACRLASA